MFLSAFRQRLLFLCFTLGLLLLAGSQTAYAQAHYNSDSATRARQQLLEASRAAQKRSLDSSRLARQRAEDSLKAVRQKHTDSLTAIRKYRESRHFKDSV